MRQSGQTETKAYQKIIKKGIMERIPGIGARELKIELNKETKKIQSGIVKELSTIKAAMTKTLETGGDIGQEKVNEKIKK